MCSGPSPGVPSTQGRSPEAPVPASTSTLADQLSAGARLDTYLPDEIVEVVQAAGIKSNLYNWQVRQTFFCKRLLNLSLLEDRMSKSTCASCWPM